MDLTSVHVGVNKRTRKKRVGRGIGSGMGKTATRGAKGQWASAGAKMPTPLFEGGQMPLFRRIPKRGFSHATWDKYYHVVNVGDLLVSGGTLTLDNGAALSVPTLTMQGGTLNGTAPINLTGATMTWTSGTVGRPVALSNRNASSVLRAASPAGCARARLRSSSARMRFLT